VSIEPRAKQTRWMLGVTAATLLACVILAACGAARPIKYYRIAPETTNAPAAASPYPITLILGQISAPNLFRDERIVYSHGSVEMGTYEDHLWTEPPPEMIENMLLESLRASGQYRTVERISSNARGDYILRGRLMAFNEVDLAQVEAHFALELELFDRKAGAVVWTQTYSHDEPANGKTISAVVEALQTNVREGLRQLTSSLNQYFASQLTH